MGERCPTSHYYDELLLSCQPCKLRCGNLPPDCLKFNPCARSTISSVKHRDVPLTKGFNSPMDAKDTNFMIWLLLALFVVLISTILIVTIILHRKRKLHGGFGKACDKITTKSKIKDTNGEQGSCDELKKPVAENEDVENPVGVAICDNGLSDYLFPLPAIEEGAAILVTTKTSACFNLGPGVRGDAFVEI
ncbi:tumor necrosis factor receptor superfamily member 17 [Engystomops pustulosus]|uniref:tumor necrosis factor receptor superfamily member 17 n=1 Tax=Engystomops pustulosus TaxID=76066 RepID=UPI003AFABAF3